jgi:hypothetical protein
VTDEPSLRCLPKILVTEQRMALDMVIYSIDLVEVAMARLQLAARHIISKYPEMDSDRRIRRGMYLDAWSVVNSIHDLRTILGKFPGELKAPEITKFIDETEVTTHLRNGIDHLPGSINNLAKKKGPSALFGGLSFVWVYELREMGIPARSRICVLPTGHFHREGERVNMADPFSIKEGPVDSFTLNAFNRMINLSDMARKVAAFGKFMNEAVGAHIKQSVEEKAQELGLDAADLLQHAAADGMFVVDMTYNYDAEAPPSSG